MHFEGKERINSNEELISTCRHKRKYKLGRIKGSEEVDLMKHTIQTMNEPVLNTRNQSPIIIEVPRRGTRVRKMNTKWNSKEWTT